MKEMQSIKNEFDSLSKRLAKPEEIGSIELGKIFEELKNLDNKANISANSFVRNPQSDMNEVREVLNIWSDLREDIRVKLVEAETHRNSKKELLEAKFAEYRKVKGYKRDNQNSIKEHEFELDKHKALLNHISDPFAKDNMQDTIKDDEKHITKCELLNNRYDSELANLEREIRTLLNGGKIKKVDVVEEEEILEEINRDSIKKPAPKAEKTEEIKPEVEAEEVKPLDTFAARENEEVDDFINPFATDPIEVPYRESKPHDEHEFMFMPPEEPGELEPTEVIEEPEPAEEWPDIVPDFFKKRDEDLAVEPPKKVEKPAQRHSLPPEFEVGEPARDEAPAKKRDLPPSFEVDKPTRTEEPAKKRTLPPEFEIDEIEDENLDEEKTPVSAKVVQPKSTLWAKIGEVLKSAKEFLSKKSSTQNTEKIKKIAKDDKPKSTDLNANVEPKPAFDAIEEIRQSEKDWYDSLAASGLNK